MTAESESYLLLSDGEKLHRRILECPDDDAPRLAYSDWLEENGEDERAEFIRLMIADPDHSLIYDGGGTSPVSQLLHRHGHAWLGEWYGDGHGVGRKFGWNRGFVSEVRLTCAAFMGGLCPTCGGRGEINRGQRNDPEFDGDTCPACSGTGRVEGLAGRLFREHPITRVILTDRQPLAVEGSWSWVSHPDADWLWTDRERPQFLPGEIWTTLSGFLTAPSARTRARRYQTDQQAFDALSRACVAYGRALVGLPPLNTERGE